LTGYPRVYHIQPSINKFFRLRWVNPCTKSLITSGDLNRYCHGTIKCYVDSWFEGAQYVV